MVLNDAFSDMPIVGKPQCHIIPLAMEQNQIAMSTGCTLSRIRTGMSPDEMTCAIPARRFIEVVEKIRWSSIHEETALIQLLGKMKA
jgi:uncharacterized protein (DUF169 family)